MAGMMGLLGKAKEKIKYIRREKSTHDTAPTMSQLWVEQAALGHTQRCGPMAHMVTVTGSDMALTTAIHACGCRL